MVFVCALSVSWIATPLLRFGEGVVLLSQGEERWTLAAVISGGDVSGIGEFGLAFDGDALGEGDLSFDCDAVGLDEGGGDAELGEGIDELVFAGKFDDGWLACASGDEGDAAVGALFVGIAAQGEEVGGGLDGGEAGAGDFHCYCAVEALDGGTHGGF